MSRPSVITFACASLCALTSSIAFAAPINNTLFLHHFDSPITSPLSAPGDADFAAGTATPVTAAKGIDPSQAKFGPASAYIGGGVGGRLTYRVDDGNLNIPKGTVEMWVRPNSSYLQQGAVYGFFGAYRVLTGQDIRMQQTSGGLLQAYMSSSDATVGGGAGSIWSVTSTAPLLLAQGTWNHIAWSWDFDTQTTGLYLNGTALGATVAKTNPATLHFTGPLSATRFLIGEVQNGSATFPGWFDEFRISDIDRYQNQNFTPPTSPFVVPEPAATALLGLGLFAFRRRK